MTVSRIKESLTSIYSNFNHYKGFGGIINKWGTTMEIGVVAQSWRLLKVLEDREYGRNRGKTGKTKDLFYVLGEVANPECLNSAIDYSTSSTSFS